MSIGFALGTAGPWEGVSCLSGPEIGPYQEGKAQLSIGVQLQGCSGGETHHLHGLVDFVWYLQVCILCVMCIIMTVIIICEKNTRGYLILGAFNTGGAFNTRGHLILGGI